jgi:hypothetical protein
MSPLSCAGPIPRAPLAEGSPLWGFDRLGSIGTIDHGQANPPDQVDFSPIWQIIDQRHHRQIFIEIRMMQYNTSHCMSDVRAEPHLWPIPGPMAKNDQIRDGS